MTVFAIDFDGTIVENAYPKIGPLVLDAYNTMWLMKDYGHTIIIWTCRYGQDLEDMKKFLQENDVPYDIINDHAPQYAEIYGGTARKVFADYYIDDRNIGKWSWDDIVNLMLEFGEKDRLAYIEKYCKKGCEIYMGRCTAMTSSIKVCATKKRRSLKAVVS